MIFVSRQFSTLAGCTSRISIQGKQLSAVALQWFCKALGVQERKSELSANLEDQPCSLLQLLTDNLVVPSVQAIERRVAAGLVERESHDGPCLVFRVIASVLASVIASEAVGVNRCWAQHCRIRTTQPHQNQICGLRRKRRWI